MSNPNAAVRYFLGGINSSAYWIGDHLLRGGDIVNDSTVTGATVKAALNTLSTASTAVFPFIASGLAEQDLVSYDAGAATWRNRTIANALKGAGTTSLAIGASAVAAGTSDIVIGTSAGTASNTGSNNIAIGTDTLDSATGAVQNMVAVGNSALSGAVTSNANGSVAIGSGALQVFAPASPGMPTAVGFQSLSQNTTGVANTALGSNSGARVTTAHDNVFVGENAGYAVTVSGGGNVAVGVGSLSNASVTNIIGTMVAVGNLALSGVLVLAAAGAVAVGKSSLASLTSGAKNTAVGFQSGTSIITGSRNTIFGFSTDSTAASDDNTFLGDEVGSTNVGSRNTAVGSLAFNSASAAVTDTVSVGYNALTGTISTTAPSGSVAIGSTALQAVTTGLNTAVGFANQLAITTGTRNTTLGYNVMSHASTAVATSDCVGIGSGALVGALTVGANGSVAVGSGALQTLTSGAANTAVGYQAGLAYSNGSNNTSVGYQAGSSASTGLSNCTAIGYRACVAVNTLAASAPTAVGSGALSSLNSGDGNSAFGYNAGDTLTTGASNTIVGYDADVTANSRSGCVILGRGASGAADDTFVVRLGNTSAKEFVSTMAITAKGTSTSTVDANTDYLVVVIGGVTRYIELKTTP